LEGGGKNTFKELRISHEYGGVKKSDPGKESLEDEIAQGRNWKEGFGNVFLWKGCDASGGEGVKDIERKGDTTRTVQAKSLDTATRKNGSEGDHKQTVAKRGIKIHVVLSLFKVKKGGERESFGMEGQP